MRTIIPIVPSGLKKVFPDQFDNLCLIQDVLENEDLDFEIKVKLKMVDLTPDGEWTESNFDEFVIEIHRTESNKNHPLFTRFEEVNNKHSEASEGKHSKMITHFSQEDVFHRINHLTGFSVNRVVWIWDNPLRIFLKRL